MEERQNISIVEQPREESKIKKYFRYFGISLFLVVVAAAIIGAIMKKFGA